MIAPINRCFNNKSADNLNWSFNFRKEFNLPLYFNVEAYNTYYIIQRRYKQGFIGVVPWKETVYIPCRHNSKIIVFEDAYKEDKITL